MTYTCSYYIEIVSQFSIPSKRYGIRCYHADLTIMDSMNSIETIEFTLLESQVEDSPSWGDEEILRIIPVKNDQVRIYILNNKDEYTLVSVGLISKINYDRNRRVYSIRMNGLQEIGNGKSAKFFSKSNIKDDITDDKQIINLYNNKFGSIGSDISFSVNILEGKEELSKTKYGLELRGSDSFSALIANILLKHNLNQFVNYSIINGKPNIEIIISSKPSKVLGDNTMFDIDLDNTEGFTINYILGDEDSYNPKPQVRQKYYYVSAKGSEETDDGVRYYVFSDLFFNLSGEEGKVHIDRYSIAGYFDNEEWKDLKDRISSHQSPDTFQATFYEDFSKAKDFLNQVAYRELMSDLYDSFKIKLEINSGHKVDDVFLTDLGRVNPANSTVWQVGMGVNFNSQELGIQDRKMVITEVNLQSESASGVQVIKLTILDISIFDKFKDDDYYTFKDIINKLPVQNGSNRVEVAPILIAINDNDKISDFFNNSNSVIKQVIGVMRDTSRRGERFATQRRLLSPELDNYI